MSVPVYGTGLSASGMSCAFGGFGSSVFVAINDTVGHCVSPALPSPIGEVRSVPLQVRWGSLPALCGKSARQGCSFSFTYLPSARIGAV